MTPRGTTLYPFVPSRPQFVRSVAFFQELGFTKVWETAGEGHQRAGAARSVHRQIEATDGLRLGARDPHHRSRRCLLACPPIEAMTSPTALT